MTALAVAGLVSSGVVPGPAAAAAPGSIVVAMVDDAGAPVADFCATAQQFVDGEPLGDPATLCVEPGASTIEFSQLSDVGEYQVDASVEQSSYLLLDDTTRLVAAPADLTFVARRAAVLSGTISYRDQTVPESSSVSVEAEDGTFYQAAPVAGTWSVSVLPGPYRVVMSDDLNGIVQWAYGATSRDDATVINAEAGVTTVVDDTLLTGSGGTQRPAHLSGRLTSTDGTPLKGICVIYGVELFGDSRCEGGVKSGDDGSWQFDLPPGTWQVGFRDPAGRYASAAQSVTVTPSQTLVLETVTLLTAGGVAGIVVDARTGEPLEGSCPSAYLARTETFLYAVEQCSDRSGRWSIDGLPPGPVTVTLGGDDERVDQWVPGVQFQADAALIEVTAGVRASAGTVALPHGATLSGTIKDRRGRPVEGAWVVVGGFASRAGAGEGRWTASTDEAGRYTIKNIDRQSSVVSVYVPDQPFAWLWSGNAIDPAKAKKLAFPYDTAVRFDASLKPEASLTVRVTGHADHWTQVDATTESGAPVGWSRDVLGSGIVTIYGLPAGKVRLKIGIDGRDEELWYSGAGTGVVDTIAGSTTLTVAPGTSTVAKVDVSGYEVPPVEEPVRNRR